VRTAVRFRSAPFSEFPIPSCLLTAWDFCWELRSGAVVPTGNVSWLRRVLLPQRATHRGLCTQPTCGADGNLVASTLGDLGASFKHPGAPRPGPAPRVCADTPLDPAAKGFAPGPHWCAARPRPPATRTLRLVSRCSPLDRGWCHFVSRCYTKSPSI
jgi:hypothetical protein